MLAMNNNILSTNKLHGPLHTSATPVVSMEKHRLQMPESPFTLPPIQTLSPPPVPSSHFHGSSLKFTLRPNKLWTEEMTHKLFQCIVDHFETFSKGKKSQVWKLAARRVGLSPVQCKNKFEEQKKKWEKRSIPSAIPRPKNESDYVADQFFEKYGHLAYPGLGTSHHSPPHLASEPLSRHRTNTTSPTIPSASPKTPCNCNHWTQLEYQKYKLDKEMEVELKRMEFVNREKELEVEKLRLQLQLANMHRNSSSRRESMSMD
ncbi:hypothetical protein CONCODRAFT_76687 [Conidiobolus coronatus NRRL 28638]|uniref:Uncharacterized protein n=1 Tax=Conidiobolus coronatus (strain ATCC 28846 / CBS 209.66 / NRRL 28638) TaxID=796925 RepID=A0A137PIJ8_CONC2|nr:hypothetical protein CONCODRAFT_76687 [Conidiobolus coronatus NRRL 28638]|eukprot:KXN74817.1 hypothetical protein CONCODRAFT_76687 [Conidiobolus coronatus NRRL 28638]